MSVEMMSDDQLEDTYREIQYEMQRRRRVRITPAVVRLNVQMSEAISNHNWEHAQYLNECIQEIMMKELAQP